MNYITLSYFIYYFLYESSTIYCIKVLYLDEIILQFINLLQYNRLRYNNKINQIHCI